METLIGWTLSHWWLFAIIGCFLFVACYRWTFRLFGIVIIPQSSIGIVNKKFVLFGANRNLSDGQIIALKGEAGIQADTLAPGLHWGYWPWQYEIVIEDFITIKKGWIGVVESRDGRPISAGRILAKHVECDLFQNAREFLSNGGERGPQIAIIPPGTYRINTSLFTINTTDVVEIEDGKVGIVTTKEGKPLPSGEIAGPEIPNHSMFQNGQAFLDNGGFKGLQEQVILAGCYFFNPWLVSVEMVEMTTVPIAHVGVVISYVGEAGKDVTGDGFKHGNLVSHGERGVWVDPLDPGMYPINTRTHRVENVPTANIVLNWATGKSEAHNLDKNLCTIKVRSSDGFTFNLDVAQIINICRNYAPRVIAMFGSVSNLVTQVLEPTIGNYFRNAAQGSDVIEFLAERQARQEDAKKQIGRALEEYNVGAIDTLIGDIVPPEDLMKTLTDRKIAEQQKVTFQTQQMAEDTRKELEQSKAMAATQANVVASERKVTIANFEAQAAIENAKGQAESKKVNAEADAMVTTTVGNAEAGKIKAIGSAEAEVTQLKINSMESGNYAAVQIANALASNKIKLVPDIMISGSGSGSNNIADILLAQMIVKNQDSAKGVAPQSVAKKAAPVEAKVD